MVGRRVTCKNCDECFYITSSKTRIHKFCSKRCREINWAKNNRERIRNNQKIFRAKRYKELGRSGGNGPKEVALKRWMVELKSNPCTDCGGIFPICCMDFDHKNGTDKKYNIGSMFAHHYSKELIEEELVKCELVCANCHRVRTRDRRIGNGKYRIRVV